MKLERSQNSIRNASFGIVNKLVTILMPFIVRTVFIYTLGEEYLGLNSLFSSILTVLNLTELGFSSAIVFSMYKPIAEDDTASINALLYFYRRVYRYIGVIILAAGLLLIPSLPKLIHNAEYPSDINLTLVYLVYLLNTVLSYFLFAYLSALITAFQREDVISRINIFISLAMYGLQLAVLLTVKNYYIYISIMPLFTIVNNIRTAIVAKKMFPGYRAEGRINRQQRLVIREKIGGLLVSKVCIVSRNAFDSIFVSAFLGLVETTMYNNYYFILNSLTAVMTVMSTSVLAGVGNSVVMESEQKNYQDMGRMNFVYLWLSGWFSICLLCLYQPFMKLWVGENLMFPMPVVILFCAYFYALKMGDIRSVYVHASGLWWESRYRSILEALTNLVLNYLMGKAFGVSGIVAATLISLLFIKFGYGSHIVFKHYFTHESVWDYFRSNAVYLIVTVFIAFVTYFLCSALPWEGIGGFIIKAAFCTLIPNALYFPIYRRTPVFQDAVPWFLMRLSFGRKLLRSKEIRRLLSMEPR